MDCQTNHCVEDRFDPVQPFGAWLHRIVANAALDLQPVFSPQGDAIAFSSDRGTKLQRSRGTWEHVHAASVYLVAAMSVLVGGGPSLFGVASSSMLDPDDVAGAIVLACTQSPGSRIIEIQMRTMSESIA